MAAPSIRPATVFLVALLGTACGTPWRATTAVDPAFAPDEVRTVAVLPFFEWQLSLEDLRELTDRTVATVGRQGRNLTVITPTEAAELLTAEGLTYEWALYLNDEAQGEVPDSTAIMRMGDALGADLIAHIRFADVFQADGSADFGTAYSTATIELRLFSGSTGHVAWSSLAVAEQRTNSWSDRAPSLVGPVKWVFGAVLGEVPPLGTVVSR